MYKPKKLSSRFLPLFAIAAVSLAIFFSSERSGQKDADTIEVGVRAAIEAPAIVGILGDTAAETTTAGAKTFAFMPPAEVVSREKLMPPVDSSTLDGILSSLQEKLTARDFAIVHGRERPDIAVNVQYGRGFLPNPYLSPHAAADEVRLNETAPPAAQTRDRSDAGPSAASTGRNSVGELAGTHEPGREAKMRGANREKLFLIVTAWDFESMTKGNEPKKLWTTTLSVDDPDHRDLNRIYKQMIEAGGEYYGKTIDAAEIEVPTMFRAGRIQVGTKVEEQKLEK